MEKKKIFLKAAQYALIAFIGSVSLILIAFGVWIAWAVAAGSAFIVIFIIAMLVIFGLAAYQENDACCRKWALKSKLVLLVEFLPMFCLSAIYFLRVLYRINMNDYGGYMGGLAAALDIGISLSLSVSFLATVVFIFLSCVIIGAVKKRSKGSDC